MPLLVIFIAKNVIKKEKTKEEIIKNDKRKKYNTKYLHTTLHQ
jgi:hypothetical protein